ncbi:PilZ domain-containing protein [Shewanella sp. SR44-3]|uniref:PilZ domain-containing protein n=1 Tax=unclassified Shewanella TaxID=196818 RepID=UPI0015F86383|nr:PilZ domain-containing protein [Shewanella sp. SR44-3]MBB1270188.1 PilZ domain-containing protein [Shewanella sp. SR44-3]
MDEKRRFSRFLFATSAHLYQGDAVWETKILDLCLNGALVETPPDFEPNNTALSLVFFLPDSEIKITMEVGIIVKDTVNLRLECLHIDIDSISHLKRMVELNLGDTELLHRELALFIEEHEHAHGI